MFVRERKDGMNVGIMLSEQLRLPEAGGGFTFEQEVLEALLRMRIQSPHRFFLLGDATEPPAFPGAENLPWLTTSRPPPPVAPPPPPPPPPPTLWTRMSKEWDRIVGTPNPEREPPAVQEPTVETPSVFDFDPFPAVKNASLELVCYLNPWVSPFLDLPYVLNLWDLAHRIYPFFPEISLAGEWETRERFFRMRLQRASYIITPNACGKREIIYLYQVAEEKVRTLHHPTPTFALKAADRSEKIPLDHLGVKADFLLYPAQFWPHKNHVLLLHVLKSLRDKYGFAPQLVFTGSDKPLFNHAKKGNQAFIQESAAELSLQDQVIFAGFVSRDDLIALYQQAVAMVYPSFFGPENLPPLEALALGCPVIVSRIPGSEEQFGDAALQVDPTVSEAWADAIQKLRQDPNLRRSLIAKGKERAARFTADDFVRGLFQIIDEFAAYRRTWPSSL
jgi:glycosyltransferase involved in cell wall biosynthesis